MLKRHLRKHLARIKTAKDREERTDDEKATDARYSSSDDNNDDVNAPSGVVLAVGRFYKKTTAR